MILRKPYAFLIKFFKIIHIAMFVLYVYLLFSLRNIHSFFVNYVKAGSFTYIKDLTGDYVPFLLFIVVLFLLAANVLIYLLMKKKEKPVLFYLISVIYCSVIFIGISVYRSFFESLEFNTYEIISVVFYRDVMAFLYYGCYAFVVFSFIRGFGFDIRKFSFEKDKKELNLTSSDNEEVEVGISLDRNDIGAIIRKNRREFKSYFIENKTIIVAILSVIGVVLLIMGYNYIFVENRIYGEKSTITIGNVDYKVIDTFVSNEDKFNEVLSYNWSYVIVKVKVNNRNRTKVGFNNEIFRLYSSSDSVYYYPSYTSCDNFSDVGICFNSSRIIDVGENEYILSFKLDNYSKKFKGYFEILSNSKRLKYEKMRFNSSFITKSDINNKIGDEINIDGKTFVVRNYNISDSTYYEYEKCNDDNCEVYKRAIKPSIGNVVLTIDVSDIDTFKDDRLELYYYVEGQKYIISFKNISVIDKYENNIYYSVPKMFNSFDNKGLIFNTRSAYYNISLGGNNE